jgi:hypothetical protein
MQIQSKLLNREEKKKNQPNCNLIVHRKTPKLELNPEVEKEILSLSQT